jgi:hypothetical protein
MVVSALDGVTCGASLGHGAFRQAYDQLTDEDHAHSASEETLMTEAQDLPRAF